MWRLILKPDLSIPVATTMIVGTLASRKGLENR